jgi:hypothetical protein
MLLDAYANASIICFIKDDCYTKYDFNTAMRLLEN